MKSTKPLVFHQTGAVLIIGMVMLVLLTIVGLAAIRGSDMQERMAGNMRDRNLAFQAAEAALRKGEDIPFVKFDGTVPGYFPDLNTKTGATRVVDWTKADWENNSNSISLAANTLTGLVQQPRYIVESLQVPLAPATEGGAVDVESMEQMADKEYFRITSRGLGGTQDSEVVLQSTFVR